MYIGLTATYLILKICYDLVLTFSTKCSCAWYHWYLLYHIQKSLSPSCLSCKLYDDTECKLCQLSFSLRQYLCNRTDCILEILLEWVSFCGIRIMTIITKKENFTAPMRKRIKTPHPISLTSRMCIFTDDLFFHFPRSPPQHFFLLALSPLFLASWKCRVFGTSWTDWFGVGNSFTVHNWIKWEFWCSSD